MEKKLTKKIKTAEEAARLYMEKKDFSMNALADRLKMKPSELYELFPNRRALLRFFYTAQIHKYREITRNVEGYNDYTLAEKMSHLALTLTDLLLEHREFVSQTFRATICNFKKKPDFNTLLEDEVSGFLKDDPKISSSAALFTGPWACSLIRVQYEWLILYWLADESEGMQKTMALIDKWTGFVQELFYTSIIDKSFDLAKFLFVQSQLREWFTPHKNSTRTQTENAS